MINGAPTGSDLDAITDESASIAAARAALPATNVPKIILRPPTGLKPRLITPASGQDHLGLPLTPRLSKSTTSIVPTNTLPGIPVSGFAVPKTPASVVAVSAVAAADALATPPSVTEADMKSLAVGDRVVSLSGTTREIIAIDWDNFAFRRTKKITGIELKYFATKPAEWEEKWDEANFANMKQSDHVYNGGIDYTIKSILKTSEGVVTEVLLSHTETIENYRAQWYDHIRRIDKKPRFEKVIFSDVPPASTDVPTA